MMDIFRVGKQDPLTIAKAVKNYIKKAQIEKAQLADRIQLSIWNDRSKMYAERADLLKRNALMGLVLVFVVLGLFLVVVGGIYLAVTMMKDK